FVIVTIRPVCIAPRQPLHAGLTPHPRPEFFRTKLFQDPSSSRPMSPTEPASWHATTILTVRKDGAVVIAGDGQVSIGQTIVKANAKKVRRLGKGEVIAGFAGATADAFTPFERLAAKLEQYPGQLTRAALELATGWRHAPHLRLRAAMRL